MQIVKKGWAGIDLLLKGYLSLMNEIDNEDILNALEQILVVFKHDIKHFATDVCGHLKQ